MQKVREVVRINDFKVGDTLEYAHAEYRIATLAVNRGYVTVSLFGVDFEHTTSDTFPSGTKRIRVRKVEPRTCAPCRDSDCDCIYDGVG